MPKVSVRSLLDGSEPGVLRMMKEVQLRKLWVVRPVCTVQTPPWTSSTARTRTHTYTTSHTHTHTHVHTTYVHVTQHSRSIIYTYRTSVRLYTLSLYQLVLLSHVRMWRVAAPYCTVTCTAYNKAYGVNALTTWRTSIVARHRTRGVWMNLKEALTSRDSYRTELDSRSS